MDLMEEIIDMKTSSRRKGVEWIIAVTVFFVVLFLLSACSPNKLYPNPEKIPEGAGAVHCIDYGANASSGLFSAGTFAGHGEGCICYYYGDLYEDVSVRAGDGCGTVVGPDPD